MAVSTSTNSAISCQGKPLGCRRAVDYEEPLCKLDNRSLPQRREALFIPGCSFPCGSPNAAIKHVSPDLVRLFLEGASLGVRVLSVVMVREPVAFVASAYFRRHPESSFRATAFNLYLNLGLLDYQIQAIGKDYYFLAHYEQIIDGFNRTLVDRLADFLSMPPAKLGKAFALARKKGPPLRIADHDRAYVENLYYRATSRPFFPVFWDAFHAYKSADFWARPSPRPRR